MRTFLPIAASLFFLSEFLNMILNRSKKNNTKISGDRSSLIILWIVIMLSTILSGFLAAYFPFKQRLYLLEWTGVIIFIFGILVRWTAIIQLGKMFTVNVSISNEHKIKDNGLYKNIRHPSYLGLLLEFLGLSFLYNSWVPLIVINIPVFLALAYRVHIEESLLTSHLGEEYKDYITRTKRIIPFIF